MNGSYTNAGLAEQETSLDTTINIKSVEVGILRLGPAIIHMKADWIGQNREWG